jgi:acyl-CoA thioesterase FadM
MPLVLGLRFPFTAFRSRRRPTASLLEETRLHMRVQLRDCDFNLHVNNGRYLSLMDLGRTDAIGRARLFPVMRAHKWHPVAGGVTIRFRRELRYRSRYVLRTRCVGWDEGWWYFEQVFERPDGLLSARAYAKVAVLDSDGGRVTPATHSEQIGVAAESPPLPDSLLAWLASGHG